MVPKLTIIIPLEPSAGENLQGLTALTEGLTCECEVLLLDWRSPKNSLEFVKKCFANHYPTRILTLPDNTSPGKVFNTALKKAQGEFLTFVDPNDEPTPRVIERILNNLDSKNTLDLLLLSATVGKLEEDNFFVPQFHKRSFSTPSEGSGLRMLEKLGRENGYLRCELFLGCYKRSFIIEHELFVSEDLNDLMALEWLPRVFFYAHYCSTLKNTLPCWWDFNKPSQVFLKREQNFLEALPKAIMVLAKFFDEHHKEMPQSTCKAWAETTFHPLLRKIYSPIHPERRFNKNKLREALNKLWGVPENLPYLYNLEKHLTKKERILLALLRHFAKYGFELLPKIWAKFMRL